ncbi:hypothetical protein F5Y00DRAFT_261402 [Daldinia vernicosa]|uniref:uncharacterized protein n=1 Tax=Daldinia vernicosa TaxID=114800 RepID=UPI002007D47C|nr:uncharacterized protein F5Y00DRAFT_261402 [Daldinia vernicosa]KAI0849617.1 hypothetical protein F5Y00DRAFT_261402 [Daldinia vernicosa]
MEQTTGQTPGSEQPITVDTQYFHEVLTHFNEEGHLINRNTRFNIKCSICQDAHLSLVNHDFDKKSRATHEPFAVLPRCGHAFGYECISQWLMRDINIGNPRCPTCRTDVFSSRMQPEVLHVFGTCEPEEQHLEIVAIRESLRTNDTPPTQEPSEPRPGMELPRNPQIVYLENAQMFQLSEEEGRTAFRMRLLGLGLPPPRW